MENLELRTDRESENQSVTRLNEAAEKRIRVEFVEEKPRVGVLALERRVSPFAAWSHFGLLIGTIPPLAIFWRISLINQNSEVFLLLLTLAMAVTCAVAGRFTAGYLSRTMSNFADLSWRQMLVLLPCFGLLWGMFTGFCGGLPFFGIGAIGGVIFAVPVGVVAFTLFGIFQRLLAESGDLERRYFLPIAYGICLTISAFILGF